MPPQTPIIQRSLVARFRPPIMPKPPVASIHRAADKRVSRKPIFVLCSGGRTARSVGYTGLPSQEGGVAQSRSSRKLERREEKVPFSDNRKLRPFWCIDPRVPVNCGHGRRSGAAAKTLVVGGGPRTGASARGSSGTRTHGADRARVGAPLGELREIRSGRGGANPKGACGEQYERLCLSGGHGSGEERTVGD